MSINQYAIILISISVVISAIIPGFIVLSVMVVILFFLSPFFKETNSDFKQEVNAVLYQGIKPSKNLDDFIDVSKKQSYLLSSKWKKKIMQRLQLDNYECCGCGSKKQLEVHHNSYANLYNESINDIETLCRTCHQHVHDTYGYSYNTYYPKQNGLDI